jgi:hypothetical protein
MSDKEYVQDESETVELVVWEEWVTWAKATLEMEQSHPKEQDGACGGSQRESP